MIPALSSSVHQPKSPGHPSRPNICSFSCNGRPGFLSAFTQTTDMAFTRQCMSEIECIGYFLAIALFAAAATSSGASPKWRSSSSGWPEWPKQSFTPTISRGVGRAVLSTSATAPPRPPITLCSSAVTIAPVSCCRQDQLPVNGFNRMHIDHACMDPLCL